MMLLNVFVPSIFIVALQFFDEFFGSDLSPAVDVGFVLFVRGSVESLSLKGGQKIELRSVSMVNTASFNTLTRRSVGLT